MTPINEKLKQRLLAMGGDQIDARLVQEIITVLQTNDSMIDNIAQYLQSQNVFCIPLADGIRAEVKIYGNAKPEHVKAFASIFWYIADNYSQKPVESAPSQKEE